MTVDRPVDWHAQCTQQQFGRPMKGTVDRLARAMFLLGSVERGEGRLTKHRLTEESAGSIGIRTRF